MTVNRQTCANAIRILSVDAVQKAKSGHPGMPMGMADIAEVLWRDFLRHNPENPHWLNRDRFVLSNGHGSMLLYSLLHLSGYDLTIEDLKNFRQLHSKTPGHPEYGYAPGIEATTGPLGQGIGNAVGMALAEKLLAIQFNQDHFNLIDHYTYCFLGDGCLMEGISHEVCSLAGTLQLHKLIVFWDDNGISIDGHVDGWFTDNTPKRFESYGWQVLPDIDGHNPKAIKQAIIEAQQNTNQPTLICCKTIIGFGSPNLGGSVKTHGSPLGDEEIARVRQQLNWTDTPFVIPEAIYSAWDASTKGTILENQWDNLFANYSQQYPESAMQLTRRYTSALPNDWANFCQQMLVDITKLNKPMATRQATTICLDQLTLKLPELLGGSADLSSSNGTQSKYAKAITAHQANGNYLHYGIREFGMSAIMNGITLHGGFIPFGGTFLTFSDYARNAVRMAALMRISTIFVYSHDSIGLGEDGPTHQAIEHIPALRLIPNLHVWRPCDCVETAIAWQKAIEQTDIPSCILLTRQTVAEQNRGEQTLENIKRGAYILHDCHDKPDIILIATGSEVELAMKAANLHSDKRIRVVSMPCVEVFEQQPNDYQESVLPPKVTKRIAIEAAHSDYWIKYVGWSGKVLGIEQFGKSAPVNQLWKNFGFTLEHVSKLIGELVD